jgi:hypothetical protein
MQVDTEEALRTKPIFWSYSLPPSHSHVSVRYPYQTLYGSSSADNVTSASPQPRAKPTLALSLLAIIATILSSLPRDASTNYTLPHYPQNHSPTIKALCTHYPHQTLNTRKEHCAQLHNPATRIQRIVQTQKSNRI